MIVLIPSSLWHVETHGYCGYWCTYSESPKHQSKFLWRTYKPEYHRSACRTTRSRSPFKTSVNEFIVTRIFDLHEKQKINTHHENLSCNKLQTYKSTWKRIRSNITYISISMKHFVVIHCFMLVSCNATDNTSYNTLIQWFWPHEIVVLFIKTSEP
jgi:hypothetical protein